MQAVRREVELKYRLKSRGDYEALCHRLGNPAEEFEQVNHFFRSRDGRVPGSRGVIRLRLEKGKALFTVKLGGALEEGLVSADEYEEPWKGSLENLPPNAEALWDEGYAGMKAVADAFGGPHPLVWAGKMINRRKVYNLSEGICLELDASLYPDGHEDFEVEVETEKPEEDRERLRNLLERLGVDNEPQTETKYQRFLAHVEDPS